MADERTEEAKSAKILSTVLDRLEQLALENRELKQERDRYRALGPKITPDSQVAIVRAERPPEGGAYVVKMPRSWNGTRMGITFRGGVGVIDASLENADTIAHWMEADYGYEIVAVGPKDLLRVRKSMEGVKVNDKDMTATEKLMSTGQL